MRRAAKRDTVESAIVAEWELLGAHSEAVSDRGFPDRVVFHQGRTYLAETKTGKKGLTKAQVETFTRLHNKGVPAYVVRTPSEAGRMLWGDLPAWKPSQGSATQSMPRAFRPGYSRARATNEICRVSNCALSCLPGRYVCHEHA